MAKRNGLVVLRAQRGATQKDFSERLGVSVPTYSLIEQGKRNGSDDFWIALQKECNLTGGEIWELRTKNK